MKNPNWKRLTVEAKLPEQLSPLKEISQNLWWCWNADACQLFQEIDEELWHSVEHNPIVLLNHLSHNKIDELESDKTFINKMKKIHTRLQKYLKERSNYKQHQIAYFSMEYGLHDSLKIFSGGLGILAGDYLKEASDSKVNLVAVGLLYRYGYFKQTITKDGKQVANYEAQEFGNIPVHPVYDEDGKFIEIVVDYPGRELKARVWEAKVGAVSLYLLDADYEANQDQDRFVTHHLYGGDNENRIKQEMLLGLGGIRALRKLGYASDIYHCNEGHAAFIGLERLRELMTDDKLSYAQAKEVVRSSTLFTTHTPVPAGHDSFHQDLFGTYMGKFAACVGLDWNSFVGLGKANPSEDHFNMSYLAANLSQGINGVSWLHGDVSKEILKDLYPGYLPEELAIGYVTNGVHYPTWTAKEWKKLYLKYFGDDFETHQLSFGLWKNIVEVPDQDIWKIKKALKTKMFNYIRNRFTANKISNNESPKLITDTIQLLNPDALTIGFARRFATYKRAHLLFRNLDRLSKIVNNPDHPVQFVFAGKAHPADSAGQGLIEHIYEISKRPEFLGKIIFVQNYDMDLASKLVQGVDIWLNTPTRPLEASGTSGEKAAMNGTMHFSVLDGWWVEGYKENAGWMLPLERSYEDQELQDELDAETIYNTFESDIVPKYYNRNKKEYSEEWVQIIKNTIAEVAPNFTTTRMIHDYDERFYIPQAKRHAEIIANDFALAKDIAAWKEKVSAKWDGIRVVDMRISDTSNRINVTENYSGKLKVDLNGLSAEEIGAEVIYKANTEKAKAKTDQLSFVEAKDGIAEYKLDLHLEDPGVYNVGLRIYAKDDRLPHRQDFQLIKWL